MDRQLELPYPETLPALCWWNNPSSIPPPSLLVATVQTDEAEVSDADAVETTMETPLSSAQRRCSWRATSFPLPFDWFLEPKEEEEEGGGEEPQ